MHVRFIPDFPAQRLVLPGWFTCGTFNSSWFRASLVVWLQCVHLMHDYAIRRTELQRVFVLHLGRIFVYAKCCVHIKRRHRFNAIITQKPCLSTNSYLTVSPNSSTRSDTIHHRQITIVRKALQSIALPR